MFTAAILLEGAACHMRLAIGQTVNGKAYAVAAEWRCALSPGFNLFHFKVEDLIALRGDIDLRSINHASFGGNAAHCRIVAQVCEFKP